MTYPGAYRDEQAREEHVAEEARAMMEAECRHCWHDYQGPTWILLKDGYIVQACCRCKARRNVHAAHATGN